MDQLPHIPDDPPPAPGAAPAGRPPPSVLGWVVMLMSGVIGTGVMKNCSQDAQVDALRRSAAAEKAAREEEVEGLKRQVREIRAGQEGRPAGPPPR